MQLSNVALWANGYRTTKCKSGHHRTAIQALVPAIGLDTGEIRLLDTFRIKRNAVDYTGDLVDDQSVEECIRAAERLQHAVRDWLNK